MNTQPKLVQCGVCGNYYDANAHSDCPICSQQRNRTLVRCGNCGAIYDSSVHRSCPQCSEGDFPYTMPPEGLSEPTASSPVWSKPAANMVTCRKCGRTYDANVNSFCPYCEDVSNTVGWLLAVSGPMRGNAFNLHSGYNYIGREVGDAILSKDFRVARQSHAVIIYTEDEDTYQFGPTGKYPVRLNSEEVSDCELIYNGDILEIGESMLMFVPLADTPEWLTEEDEEEGWA